MIIKIEENPCCHEKINQPNKFTFVFNLKLIEVKK